MWAFLLQPYTRGLEASCGADTARTLDQERGKTNLHNECCFNPSGGDWLGDQGGKLVVCTATHTNDGKSGKIMQVKMKMK